MCMMKKIKIAVCGNLATVCTALRKHGISKIDKYNDAVELAFKLRQGEEYHMILVHAPHGEGLTDAEYPYKSEDGEWKTVPLRLLDEPACHSAILELLTAVNTIAKELAS